MVGIDPAITILCMCKITFLCGFFDDISITLSIHFLFRATGHNFRAILMLSGSNSTFSQPLVPFVVLMILLSTKGVVNRRFQAKCAKYRNFHTIQTAASLPTKFLNSDKDNQVLFVGDPNLCPRNPTSWMTTIFKRSINCHISATI